MPRTPTDAENRKFVRNAIAAAKKSSTTDADFVRMLRASYFTQHPAIEHGVRAVSERSSDVEPTQSIYDDPRFAKNARALAERKKENLRIIGGKDVKGAEFPDCVAVGNAKRWCCTGTLIAPTVVLSAGHCKECATRVFFGNDVTKKGTIINAIRTVQHPKYHKADHNDLLLLILERPATVKPRKIASASAITTATSGRAVGFGHIDVSGSFGYGIKREVDVPIGSTGCSGKVGGKSDAAAYGCDTGLEIVAGKAILTQDSCKGDSGGPFYIRGPSSTWLLAGATSRSSKGARPGRICGDGGIYVRVDKYRDWIQETANIELP
jgi:secreted trypsin-like serine protease